MVAPDELATIRRRVALVGRWSDGLVRIGPWGIGLDGVLDWIPGVGEAYSLIAGTYILVQGARAGTRFSILAVAGALMAARTVITVVPVLGSILADLLTTHGFAARLIVRDIDRRMGEGPAILPAPALPA
jgi:hypothetical protein